MRPRERRHSGEQDLFRSCRDQIIDMDLPTRLMAGLAVLKHTYDLSDEVVCEQWIENPYYQHFCGEEFFQHQLPLDRSSMRHRMGEEQLAALFQESLAVATRTGAMRPSDLSRVVVDTTVRPRTSPSRPTPSS
jgi:hypothetical protein